MNTASIIENMNYLPSFAKEVVKEPKISTASVREAKYWRYMGSHYAIQPTKGDKPSSTFKGKTKGATKADLNWSKIYVAYVLDGVMQIGTSMSPPLLFDLIKAGHFGKFDPTGKKKLPIMRNLDEYFTQLGELTKALTPDQTALLS